MADSIFILFNMPVNGSAEVVLSYDESTDRWNDDNNIEKYLPHLYNEIISKLQPVIREYINAKNPATTV